MVEFHRRVPAVEEGLLICAYAPNSPVVPEPWKVPEPSSHRKSYGDMKTGVRRDRDFLCYIRMRFFA